ncbi:Proteasome, subunit alpha/beta [Carpediemonas membranifera]|uniref:Proteasome, subunit alpha/beta n=1 Tax=Carpediemonas membranifera TaxID=201153 RepID=A0A8J6B384_9EUKA|nr:Proteasome, subunit alpha/beta [Carpediemonas membranifera]|eukprot:KAG9392009.1 Proteasome, subunit alpha/beta [Carpediemonas membranifera]
MFLTRNEHDKGNTFSPEGRIFQVEYAIEAVKLGSTVVGIQTKDAVIIACERRSTSPLLISSAEKLVEVDDHVLVAMSGLTADARTLIEHARAEAQNFRFNYNEPITVGHLTQSVCDLSLRFGHDEEDIMSRPFGVALLIGGIDPREGPVLYHTDPSGTFAKCKGKAIGAGCDGAQQGLNREYKDDMTVEESEKCVVSLLKQVMEEKLTTENVQVVRLSTDGIQHYNSEQMQGIIDSLPAPELE